MTILSYPDKPRPGDRVAVVSPSSGLPGILPLPYELGLRRLREEFGLEVVEYPATRTMGSTPAERAADIHAAFADPSASPFVSSASPPDRSSERARLGGRRLDRGGGHRRRRRVGRTDRGLTAVRVPGAAGGSNAGQGAPNLWSDHMACVT